MPVDFDIDPSTVNEALAAMSAEELRAMVRELLLELEGPAQARVLDALMDRAARSSSEWVPDGPSEESISSVVSFAASAKRMGYADPADVDDYLRQGSRAFLSKDYAGAFRIYQALLLSISEGEIYLGQHEMFDEVLSVDVTSCAAQYVVAMYMTAVPARRAQAVLAAIKDVYPVGYFRTPLQEMERVAIEPLPRFDAFLPRWRALIEESSAEQEQEGTAESEWLREVVQRMEGVEGLAGLARSTRQSEDLRTWCRALVDAGDWEAALAAYEEAAGTVSGEAYERAEFLDGAALAAQELGRRDLPKRLERAWRERPSMLRLCRWLGTSKSRATLSKRAAQAIDACPTKSTRQLAFLHVLLGDVAAASKLLAAARALGWSCDEHPGHFVFALFQAMLGENLDSAGSRPTLVCGMEIDELEWFLDECERPRLAEPDVEEILKLAGADKPVCTDARAAMLKSMRKACEKRAAGIIGNKYRRHYGHVAQLVATCAGLDAAPVTARWVARIREKYRRYPAFQRELHDHLGG